MASATVLSPIEAAAPHGYAAAAPLPDVLPPVKPRKGFIGFLRRNPTMAVGGFLLLLMLFVAVFAPLLWTADPTALAPAKRTREPSALYWFGTDMLGRDVYSRVIYGARVSLMVGFSVAFCAGIVGTTIGLVSGFIRGVDAIVMRVVDVFFAFPFYVLVIVLVFVFGSGEKSIYLAIAAVSWVAYAKIMRGELLVAKKQDYVVAARLGGMSHGRILVKHIAPNVLSQALIYAMSDIVMDILAIVTLGYLGLGIAPPTAEWGSMILDGQEFITTQWLQATIPGLAVVVTSLGLSLLGDGLSDQLSPERRK